jgi:transcriptional regulator with XRE-family HTH domain
MKALADPYFSRRLRQFRNAALLTQTELAARAGIHRATVSRYEAGTFEPTWAHVKALAAALGLSVDAFVNPEPPAEEPPPKGKRKGSD